MSTTVYGARTVNRRRRSRTELAEVDETIVAAVAEEHPVSLRGVYYRVVCAGAVEKTEEGYRLVGRQLLKLRRDRVIPHWQITDGTRYILRPTTYASTEAALADVAASYRRQLWRDQDSDVHILSEKDAITGVIEPVTNRWDVPLGIARGYSSETFVHSVAEAVRHSGKRKVFIYQLGDHDPSGVDAWRAFCERLAGFLGDPITPNMAATNAKAEPPDDWRVPDHVWLNATAYHFLTDDRGLATVTLARLAVTEEQIRDWQLPTRPTKATDSRSAGFTGGSVEVDAVRPSVLRQLVDDAIASHVDQHALALHREVEAQERAGLESLAGRWLA